MGADQLLILVAVVTFALPLAARGLGLDVPARTASRISTAGMLLLLCRSLLTETRVALAVALAAAVVVSGAVTVAGAALVPALRRRRTALALTLVVPALATVLLLAVTSSRGILFWTAVLVGASTVGWTTGWVIRHAVRAEWGHAPPPPPGGSSVG